MFFNGSFILVLSSAGSNGALGWHRVPGYNPLATVDSVSSNNSLVLADDTFSAMGHMSHYSSIGDETTSVAIPPLPTAIFSYSSFVAYTPSLEETSSPNILPTTRPGPPQQRPPQATPMWVPSGPPKAPRNAPAPAPTPNLPPGIQMGGATHLGPVLAVNVAVLAVLLLCL